MSRFIFILFICLYSAILAQDAYPYFSDAKKQLEFEKKRIYINEVNEKEMIISGGSKNNLLRLIDENQPPTVPADIKTTYKYKYIFEMKIDNQIISEIDLLYISGLNDEADKLKKEYDDRLATTKPTIKRTPTTSSTIVSVLKWPAGLAALALYGINSGMDSPFDGVISGALALLTWIGGDILSEKLKAETPRLIYPAYEQQYSNEQLKSLSEAYNRRLYEEIKSN
tara:strand:- start:1907 stop:2584 length:678 start_codon:yes stop_codon:yes gene_type:complete